MVVRHANSAPKRNSEAFRTTNSLDLDLVALEHTSVCLKRHIGGRREAESLGQSETELDVRLKWVVIAVGVVRKRLLLDHLTHSRGLSMKVKTVRMK